LGGLIGVLIVGETIFTANFFSITGTFDFSFLASCNKLSDSLSKNI